MKSRKALVKIVSRKDMNTGAEVAATPPAAPTGPDFGRLTSAVERARGLIAEAQAQGMEVDALMVGRAVLPEVQSIVQGLRDVAHAMGVDVAGLDAEAGAQACLAAIRQLALDVGIPKCLADLGVKEADIPLLATSALKDACGLTNPRTATQADIEGIFRGAMTA